MTVKGSHDLEPRNQPTVSREPDLRSWKAEAGEKKG